MRATLADVHPARARVHGQVRSSFVHRGARSQAQALGIEEEHRALAIHRVKAPSVGRDADVMNPGAVAHRLPGRPRSRPFPLIIAKPRNPMRDPRLDKAHIRTSRVDIDDRA